MNKILSKLFNLLKYVLLILAFAITLFGIISTYKRLDKSIVDAIPIFIPFLLVFILFIVNMFVKKARMSENLLFNFTAVLVFIVIIIIGIRAKFDVNMLLFYKYKIDYNPLYFSDNLSSIKIILYCLAMSNIFFLLKSFFEDKQKIVNIPIEEGPKEVTITAQDIVKNDPEVVVIKDEIDEKEKVEEL